MTKVECLPSLFRGLLYSLGCHCRRWWRSIVCVRGIGMYSNECVLFVVVRGRGEKNTTIDQKRKREKRKENQDKNGSKIQDGKTGDKEDVSLVEPRNLKMDAESRLEK